jgi:uncharacterized membrane protein
MRISSLEKMLMGSILFSVLLILLRYYLTKEFTYGFYLWNTLLAILPVLFSRLLLRFHQFNLKAILLIAIWLLFFPNSAYMITDLFHFSERSPVPLWYDLLIVFLPAWNGLLLGIISLMQVELFLSGQMKPVWVKISMSISFLLCGYGIYLGRFLRFNSWDLIVRTRTLLYTCAGHVFHPFHHIELWSFTVLFGVLFGITYLTLQKMNQCVVLK